KGEIYIGGKGVASGYKKDKEKTQKAFIDHDELGRIYRTGDYGKLKREGYVEFLGRVDTQVKIQGHRIELGEIEARIKENSMVKDVAVVDNKNKYDKKYLCAYVVAKEGYEARKIKKYIAETLPKYMIPSYFEEIEEIPLTSNGKVNKKKLPMPSNAYLTEEEYIAPKNEVEKKLARIWSDILDIEEGKISTESDFFEIGGDSLKVQYMINAIKRDFGLKIKIKDIFTGPTLDNVSSIISTKSKEGIAVNVVDTTDKLSNTIEMETDSKYRWSPIVHWKKVQGNIEIMGKKCSENVSALFPEIYFMTQEPSTIQEIIEQFKHLDSLSVRNGIEELIKNRALVNTMIPMENLLSIVDNMYESPYDESILYDSQRYEAYKREQLNRNYGFSSKVNDGIGLVSQNDLPDELSRRRTYRVFDEEQIITFDDFSYLISVFRQNRIEDNVKYYYASAGGLYPIDIYIYIKEGRVQGFKRGLYYYNVSENMLFEVSNDCKITVNAYGRGNKEIFNSSAVSIYMIYNTDVNMPKYGSMGYLYACIDTGIMVGSLTQIAETRDIGICSIGAMNFQSIREYFNLQENQVFMHCIELGLKNTNNQVEESNVRYYPQSAAQKRLYTINQIEEGSLSYNIPIVKVIEGKVDKSKLENSYRKLVERHDILRTCFGIRNDELVQKVFKEIEFNMTYEELENGSIEHRIEEFIKPFNLDETPLLRVKLIKENESKHYLIMDIHHIISDVTSIKIMFQELAMLYSGIQLEEVKKQYKDYTLKQNELLASKEIEEQERYWLNSIRGVEKLNMPLDFQRPSIQSFEGNSIDYTLDHMLTSKLMKLAKDNQVTLFMTLLGIFNILLYKYSGQKEILIGSPISGRSNSDEERSLGMFVNILVFKNEIEENITFIDFLQGVKKNALDAYSNQDYQFEMLVDKLNIKRDLSRNPIFDIMFIMRNIDTKSIGFSDIDIINYPVESNISKYDLTLSAVEENGQIFLNMEYCSKLYQKESIIRMMNHFIELMNQITGNPERTVESLTLLSDSENQFIKNEVNNTKLKYNNYKTVVDLFEEVCEKNPSAIALRFQDAFMTYDELNGRINQLARKIIKNYEDDESKTVAIITEPSFDMIIGIFAILKTGGTYVPVDINYPQERIDYIINNSGSSLILCDKDYCLDYNPEKKYISFDIDQGEDRNNLNKVFGSNEVAYIIYTSGSTGDPKGVMVEHRNIVNFSLAMEQIFDFYPNKKVLALTTMSFDIFVLETIVPLLNVGTVVIAETKQMREPYELIRLIDNSKIDMLQLTPTRLRMLIEDKENIRGLINVKELIIGGEQFPIDLYDDISSICKNTKIYNAYGPTETTVWSTMKLITDADTINIGKPISNTQVYIVGENNDILPVGIYGELCIGGDGVTRGYINNEERTQEKYIELNINNIKERLYKTGDIARIIGNSELEINGRMDNQIKLNGYRIELGEIESKILENSNVNECAVVVKDNEKDNKHLYAFMTLIEEEDHQSFITNLKEGLRQKIPSYSTPTYFKIIDKMPLTLNGKINKLELVTYETNIVESVKYVEPKTSTEKELVRLWKEVLGCNRDIGIEDNFFDLGGNSLSAIKFVMKAKENYTISTNDVFKYQTVKQLAEQIQYDKNHLKNTLNELKTVHKGSTQKFRNSFEGKQYSDEEIRQMTRTELENIKLDYNRTYGSVDLDLLKCYNNILLIGATGYVGSYILHELLVNTNYYVTILIRAKSANEARIRLNRVLAFNFNKCKISDYSHRITIVNGDISENKLGLDYNEYNKLIDEIDCIINSAGNVSHYTDYNQSYRSNVRGVMNLLDLAKEGTIKDLHHISTMSVSTGKIRDKRSMVFSENVEVIENFNQEKEINYIKTKTMAEKLVIDARKYGINTNIFRLGNVVFNSQNGRFQQNINNNAFYLQVKSLIKFGLLPKFDTYPLELSYVDVSSKSIVSLISRESLKNEIYHIYNTNTIELSEIAEYLGVREVSVDDFIEYIHSNISGSDNMKEYIDAFIAHSGITDRYFRTVFVWDCYKTERLLERIGIRWVKPNKEKIDSMVEYGKQIGFW
ncbi:non-ribosomal peptide synthetase, partial [Vallitalea longa]|uniref:non-ribosomal peptide synthetase n=1 Tax=Vallitalea longa TaxID=2936439 RepID=UPI002492B01F